MQQSQPRALKPLFLTEMWERYGFYIVQGLLIFFLTNALGFSDTKADIISGEYLALVYISPILGGFLADRVMGFRHSIMLGAVLLCAGYAIVATSHHELIFWGLATVIMGNGFLKPNISSYLGDFYNDNDPRRDGGFTIFYMGINIGSALATLSAGYLQRYLGWSLSFAAASFGMLIAIWSFYYGYRYFENLGLPKTKANIQPAYLRCLANPISIGIICLTGIALSYALLKYASVGNVLLIILGAFLFTFLIMYAFKFERQARNRLIALIILITSSIVFWAIFFQLFISINLFVERNVDRQLFHFTIPAVNFISLEAIFIIALGLPFAYMWQRLHKRKVHPSYSIKFALAMFTTALAMGLLMLGIHFTPGSGMTQAFWVVIVYFFVTVGELLLSPIGLSMVTELAPKQLTGLMMGIWFMALGFGGSLGGELAEMASIPKNLISDVHMSNVIYSHAFANFGLIALATGVLLLILTPWLRRLTSLKP